MLAGRAQAAGLQPWLRYLESTRAVEAQVCEDPAALEDLAGVDVVVAHPGAGELPSAAESGLCDFIERGGGYLGLHCTNASWAGAGRYRRLVGGSADGRLPLGEIVSQVRDPDHDITRRLGGSLRLRDSCYAQPEPGEGSRVLLDTTWQARRLPVAYVRPAGRGRVFYWGLGETAATFRDQQVQELLYRGMRYAAGEAEAATLGVGMLGFGAIGPEHAEAIGAVAGLELRAACDRDPGRLEQAQRSGERVLGLDLVQLLEAPDVAVVVISTPPNTHAEMTARALEAGKHVVVEKPFCLRLEEADRLLEMASARGLTLSVYQSRRWDPDFLALRELVARGRLGRVFHLEAFVGGFDHPCHLWHSHAPVSGGVIFDWGAHYVDWILELIPSEVVRVSASRHKLVWHDVTNDDHFEIRMTFADQTEATFTHSDIAAARKPKWYVLGTEGAVVGHWRQGRITTRGASGRVVEERLPVTDLPCELHLLRPDGGGECHDQQVSLPAAPAHAFYRNLAGHLLAGEPLAVTAASARRNIAVMEAATRAAELDRPVQLGG